MAEPQVMIETDEVVSLDSDNGSVAPQLELGIAYEMIPLEDARRLARAARMDDREYSEITARLQEAMQNPDKAVKVTLKSNQKYMVLRNRFLKIAADNGSTVTVRKGPSGVLLVWKSSEEETARAEKRAEKKVAQPEKPKATSKKKAPSKQDTSVS